MAPYVKGEVSETLSDVLSTHNRNPFGTRPSAGLPTAAPDLVSFIAVGAGPRENGHLPPSLTPDTGLTVVVF